MVHPSIHAIALAALAAPTSDCGESICMPGLSDDSLPQRLLPPLILAGETISCRTEASINIERPTDGDRFANLRSKGRSIFATDALNVSGAQAPRETHSLASVESLQLVSMCSVPDGIAIELPSATRRAIRLARPFPAARPGERNADDPERVDMMDWLRPKPGS